jgi:predicted N-acetyltransferase YhbS
MQLEVRPCASTAEFAAAASMIEQYVGEVVDIERAERYLRIVPLERMHAAFDGSNVVGAAGAHRFDLSVPGARVQCAGITSVGVQPTHRRRGVLRSLMRAQLDAVHARGEPIAALWSSEETIYERFGYGLASWSGQIAVPRDRARFAHPLEDGGTIRLVEPDEARTLLPPVWQELMTQRPGVFSRSPEWWELRVVADRPERRGGAGPKRFVVAEREGAVRGYAIYRHKPSWEQGVPAGELRVWEAIGADARATAALWRYLLDVDWTATIHASLLPPDQSAPTPRRRAASPPLPPRRRPLDPARGRPGCARGSHVRSRRAARPRADGLVLPVERRPLATRRQWCDGDGRGARPSARRRRARLGLPRRDLVSRARGCAPHRGAPDGRRRTRRRALPRGGASLVPRDLLTALSPDRGSGRTRLSG